MLFRVRVREFKRARYELDEGPFEIVKEFAVEAMLLPRAADHLRIDGEVYIVRRVVLATSSTPGGEILPTELLVERCP